MLGLISKVSCLQRGPYKSLLLFLFHLAWKSRIRLPALIAIGFMVLDLRMQLEINIDLGMGGRQGLPLGQGNLQGDAIIIDDTDSEGTVGEDESISTGHSYHSSSSSDISEDNEIIDSDDMYPVQVSNLQSVGSQLGSTIILRGENLDEGERS